MDIERYYRASDIFSSATKRGLLPIRKTAFYALLKAGRFPPTDSVIGETRLWSGSLIREAVKQVQTGYCLNCVPSSRRCTVRITGTS